MADLSRYPQTMPADSPTPASRLAGFTPRKAVPRNRLGLALGAALVAAALGASSASALPEPATYNGISADGKIALFSTEEELAFSGDTDNEQDVFVRSYDEALERYVTREVSIGPTGGNDAYPAQYDGISAKGDAVFFSTKESLVAEDEDHSTDIYMRDLTTNTTTPTTLVSRGAASCEAKGCGNGAFDASFAPGGLTPDGEELFFVSEEKLSSADKDTSPDIYVRTQVLKPEAATALVSQGATGCESEGCGNGAFNAVSNDGSTAVFSTNESLAGEDTDELQDVYARDIGVATTRLASTPRVCPGVVDCKAVYGGVSSDGSHVFFESSEQIAAEDEDESQDVYDWTAAGGATLASTGPNSNGAFHATYKGASSDGASVFFETSEPLVPADEDTTRDVYERSGVETTLVSTGSVGGPDASFKWVSPDGSSLAVIFNTAEPLVPADEDTTQDVYERSGVETTLVSTGSVGGPDAAFAGASHDGSHVFFITSEALVAEDKDTSPSPDIYERSGSTTTLVSTGPEGGNGAFSSGLAGVSEEGDRAFFTTQERLTEGDPDAEVDIYERSASVTRLVSVGNLIALGPVAPTLTGTSPASPGTSTTPAIVGQAEPGTWVKLYATFDCSGEPVAQGTSKELGGAGLNATVAAGLTTSFRATAEADGLVSLCSSAISYKQETPPPPPPPGEEGGSGGGTNTGAGSGSGSAGSGGGAKTRGGGVTLVTPQTLITFGPASKTRKRKVVFRFSDATGQPGTNFICKLDRHGWKGCSSPKRLAKLAPGRHAFGVKAVNAVGAWDAEAAKRKFKVVR